MPFSNLTAWGGRWADIPPMGTFSLGCVCVGGSCCALPAGSTQEEEGEDDGHRATPVVERKTTFPASSPAPSPWQKHQQLKSFVGPSTPHTPQGFDSSQPLLLWTSWFVRPHPHPVPFQLTGPWEDVCSDKALLELSGGLVELRGRQLRFPDTSGQGSTRPP